VLKLIIISLNNYIFHQNSTKNYIK